MRDGRKREKTEKYEKSREVPLLEVYEGRGGSRKKGGEGSMTRDQ